jgi:iron complex transport system ATP-binding protein
MSNPVALQANRVSAWHGSRQVLHAVNANFEATQWTCIVGPNGAGKTSLLKVLAGLMPCQGELSLQGKALSSWSDQERAQQLAWLGQQDLAGDDLTVYDVVMLGRLPHQRGWHGADARDHAVVQQCLHHLQLTPWRERSLGSLSGGERQRVLLASADPPHRADWLTTVKAATQQGQTVVSVLHDLNMALRADKVVVMHQGHVVMQASPQEAVLRDCLQEVFEHRLVFHEVQGQWLVLPV